MFFTKFPYPANFTFAQSFDPTSGLAPVGKRQVKIELSAYQGGVYHVRASNNEIWAPNRALVALTPPPPASESKLSLSSAGEMVLMDDQGATILRTAPKAGFGLSAEASMWQFKVPAGARFFGMGEKNLDRTELSGMRTKWWNVDVWSDFHVGQWNESESDPSYFTTPYVAVRLDRKWVGLLLHNPAPTFMSTPGADPSRVFVEWQNTPEELIVGSESGEPNLWLIVADTLAELTRKLQKLVGVTALPPMWALGYHQSRWGYGGEDDLLDLDRRLERNRIPCSGLWLDLDYMDGYRIFTVASDMFPNGVQSVADKLAENRRRIVPIIDPGVKQEPGYPVYDDGRARGAFCLNPEGGEFVGLVWPGETVFPDFSRADVREWWTGYAREFRKIGFGAAWVDMNDPSTGPVDPSGMLFDRGQVAHAEHRNQYALGMQMATWQGFLEAKPGERPFLLSRSGFVGSSRYGAIWTGDNVSNDFYLRLSVTTALSMSISGLPFMGADIGGFGGDSGESLMTRWMQAAFLHPFCRNHATQSSTPQEPFVYGKGTRDLLAHYIRLRYRLLPYLYQVFIEHEERRDPVLRPMNLAFEDPALDGLDDQYMVGPSLLHAPILSAGGSRRGVVLPGSSRWWDARTGDWVRPGHHDIRVGRDATPLYVRHGSIVPIQREDPIVADVDLLNPAFLVALSAEVGGSASATYFADDGLSYQYRDGVRSALRVHAGVAGRSLSIQTEAISQGFGVIDPVFLLTDEFDSVTVNGAPCVQQGVELRLTGGRLTLWRVE